MKSYGLLIGVILLFSCKERVVTTQHQVIQFPKLDVILGDSMDIDGYIGKFIEIRNRLVDNKYMDSLLALETYIDTLRKYEDVDSSKIRRAYNNLGYSLENLSRIDEALQIYLKAHDFFQPAQSTDVWYVENVLGNLYNMKGDHEKSLYFYQFTERELKRLIGKKDDKQDAYQNQLERLQNNIAYLYFWTGETNKAEKILKANLSETTLHGNNIATSYALSFLSEVHVQNKEVDSLNKYLPVYEQSLRNLPNEKRDIHKNQLLKAKAGIASLKGDHAASINIYLKLTSEFDFKERNRDVAKLFTKLTAEYIAHNELDSAREAIILGSKALQLEMTEMLKGIHLYEENTISELLSTCSDLYHRKYKISMQKSFLDTAIMASQSSIKVLNLLRGKYILENSSLVSIAFQRKDLNRLIDMLYERYTPDADSLTSHLTPWVYKSKNSLLADIEAERIAYERGSSSNKSAILGLQEELKNLSHDYEATEDLSVQRAIEADMVSVRQKMIDYSQAKKEKQEIKRSQPFVEYVITDSFVYSLDNFTGKNRVKKLCTTDSLRLLHNQTQNLITSRSNEETVKASLHGLYELLLTPLMPVPLQFGIYGDDGLIALPFAALIDDTGDYLVNHHTIFQSFDKQNKAHNKFNSISILAPKYKSPSSTQGGLDLVSLNFAEDEVKAINHSWDKKVTVHNSDIDKSTFFHCLTQSDIVHYAGHTAQKDDRIYLALSNDETNLISTTQITRSPMNSRLIVLSACETGTGEIQEGEGLNSLAKSFMNAGATQIVQSLWKINDQTTSELMANFYKNFKDDNNAVTAMNNAQRQYLQSHHGQALHPYYWAGFTVTSGEVQESGFNNWYISLILLGILLILSFTLKNQKDETK